MSFTSDTNKKVIKKAFCVLAVIVLLKSVGAGQTIPTKERETSDLGCLSIQEIRIPRQFITARLKEKDWTRTSWYQSSIYVDVYRNGQIIWRSPAQKVEDNGTQEQFRYSLEDPANAMVFFRQPSDSFSCKVFMAEDEALARAVGASAGGVAGAIAGATIGGFAGAPFAGVGAIPGAIIGGVVGAVGGSASFSLPIENSRELAMFSIPPGESLFTEHKAEISEGTGILKETEIATLSLTGRLPLPTAEDGTLQLQHRYTIRLRSIRLSRSKSGVVDGGKYYAIIQQAGNPDIRIDLGVIPAGITFPLEHLVLLANRGGDSRIRVYRNKFGKDPLVFEGYQAQTDGTKWLWTKEVKSLDESDDTALLFETFDAEVLK